MQPSQTFRAKSGSNSEKVDLGLCGFTKDNKDDRDGRIRETREGNTDKKKDERETRDKERRGKRMRDRRGMKHKRLSENGGRRDDTEI